GEGTMASVIGANALIKLLFPTAIAGAGYAISQEKTRELLRELVMGPGHYSRLALVFFLLMNWKSLPFMWTVRTPTHHQSAPFFRQDMKTNTVLDHRSAYGAPWSGTCS